MGNFVSCNLDQTVNSIFRWLCAKGYIRALKENIRALKREMEDLKAKQEEVQNKVTREEVTGHRQRLSAVQVWLERVENIDTECNDLLSTSDVQLQKLCLCGLCSKNAFSSYNYGKKVFLLLEEIKKLKSEGNFETVTELTPRSGVEEMPTRHMFGHEKMLKKIWNRLMEDKVAVVGLHGMGGVGKTTLLKKINNKFIPLGGRFDVVIFVVVSQSAKISKLQDDIAEKLNLCDEVWTNKSESNKAVQILRVLKGQRFVLMLDDIWEKVDFEAIGVPFPTTENGCKVVFTTRSREVCGRMGDYKPMQVECLNIEDSWQLFKNKIGDNILRNDPVILDLARKVAAKCGGLPLALNVIGETMASKATVQEWKHAVDVLNSSAAEFSDMEKEILPILKFSYDCLLDEDIKSCFLYCALFPEDYGISKDRLIHLWICEGFMGEYQDIKSGKNKGYAILGALVRANLLMERDGHVLMHDVVRDMALWIASDFFVQARGGLCDIPRLRDWGAVKRMSLQGNKIEEIACSFKFSELTTLFLSGTKLNNIPGQFIESMQKLVVLDLAWNLDINKLPEQISVLVSLQFLDLRYTRIEQLPVSFPKLKKLTYLDVSETKNLCSLGGISELSNLRILNMLFSKVHGDVSLVKELQLLEHLQLLSITVSTELGLEEILCNQRFANCIDGLHIFGFQQKSFNISLLETMENIRFLWLERIHISEIITDMKSRESRYPCFSSLSNIFIKGCINIKDLTWILLAPNLVSLDILCSEKLEEVISKEKATNITGITVPFQKLRTLRLRNLPKLESIYHSPLPFPFLDLLLAIDCPKLRKLPLNALSDLQDEFEMKILPQGFLDLEWENDETKDRFRDFQFGSGIVTRQNLNLNRVFT